MTSAAIQHDPCPPVKSPDLTDRERLLLRGVHYFELWSSRHRRRNGPATSEVLEVLVASIAVWPQLARPTDHAFGKALRTARRLVNEHGAATVLAMLRFLTVANAELKIRSPYALISRWNEAIRLASRDTGRRPGAPLRILPESVRGGAR